jgi:hypothetical protein
MGLHKYHANEFDLLSHAVLGVSDLLRCGDATGCNVGQLSHCVGLYAECVVKPAVLKWAGAVFILNA